MAHRISNSVAIRFRVHAPTPVVAIALATSLSLTPLWTGCTGDLGEPAEPTGLPESGVSSSEFLGVWNGATRVEKLAILATLDRLNDPDDAVLDLMYETSQGDDELLGQTAVYSLHMLECKGAADRLTTLLGDHRPKHVRLAAATLVRLASSLGVDALDLAGISRRRQEIEPDDAIHLDLILASAGKPDALARLNRALALRGLASVTQDTVGEFFVAEGRGYIGFGTFYHWEPVASRPSDGGSFRRVVQ